MEILADYFSLGKAPLRSFVKMSPRCGVIRLKTYRKTAMEKFEPSRKISTRFEVSTVI